MMRAFENRPDTDVVDEPLYAHYLHVTGLEHPGRELILKSMPSDWRDAARALTDPVADGRIYYQKHMTHHITPDVELAWLDSLSNVFLIRDPELVVRSYERVRGEATLEDLGFSQQARLFEHVRAGTGEIPAVIDAADVLADPRRVLRALCDRLGIEFLEAMLSWPEGARESDGVWAPWWYGSVERSTGFAPQSTSKGVLTDAQLDLARRCRPFYEELSSHAI